MRFFMSIFSNHHQDEALSGDRPEVSDESLDGRLAKFFRKPALVLKEYPQHLGDGEEHLAMRNIRQE